MLSFVMRNIEKEKKNSGYGSGYVAVPSDFYLFKLGNYIIEADVHGGITFDKFLSKQVVKEMSGSPWIDIHEFKKYRVIGFDTNQKGDNWENCGIDMVWRETNKLGRLINNREIKLYRYGAGGERIYACVDLCYKNLEVDYSSFKYCPVCRGEVIHV